MNGVIGMCSLLADTELSPEQQEFVRTIRHSGEALLAVINDVLDLSKAESGKMTFEHIAFDLRQVVEQVGDLLAHPAHTKDLELTVRVAPGLAVHRLGDPTRLRQVLVNLAGNAIKFTGRGEVAIEVTPGSEPQAVEFSVRDTGIGIPADKIDQLFKPFSQLDAATTRKFGGTGLGLAISKEIVERLGGHITCSSTPDVGTTFRFCANLPLDPNPPATGADIDLGGKRVLIADDSMSSRRIISEMVTRLGATVCEAGSGDEVMAGIGDCDLALIDHELGGANGLALAVELKRQRPHLRVVVLGTLGRPTSGTPGVDEVDDILAKPLHHASLVDLLQRFLVSGAPARPKERGRLAAIERVTVAPDYRVLVAEDNAVNQRLAVLMLKRCGVNADLVANGHEAVEAVERRRYDLVFMDVHMPELDGLEATRQIRKRVQADRQPRIVAVTAGVSAEEIDRCRSAGMDDFLPKPFTAPDLARVLNHS